MRVNSSSKILGRQCGLDRQRGLGNQLAGAWPDDPHTDDAARFGIGENLREPIGTAERE